MAYEDIAADFTIGINKTIDYVGAAHGASGAGYYTGIYLHRWLGSLADDAKASAASSDYMDMTKLTPSERKGIDNIVQMMNGYTLTTTAIEHLYDCSIIMNDGADIYDGFVVYANEGCDVQIVQNGSIVANDFWNTVPFGETLKGLNRDVTNGIACRFLLKVRNAGTDIDSRRVLGQTRVWGKSYSEFPVNGTSRGNNTIALNYVADNNNQTSSATVATWIDITNTSEGYNAMDVDANTVNEYYYSAWDVNKPTRTINNFYERFKYLTRQATAETLYGLNGEIFRGITHQIAYTTLTGVFDDSYPVTFSGGGTAQILADNGSTTMWVQMLTGAAPIATETISQTTPDAASATVSTITATPLSYPACGQSTGSAIIGGFGFGIQTNDLTSADKITALDGVQRNPPNNQTLYVSGVVATEDQILVGPKHSTNYDIDYGQFLVSTAITGASTSVIAKAGTETPGTGTQSATDTPASGKIRVTGDDGIVYDVTYTGYTVEASTMTFTGCSGCPTAAVNNPLCIAYIDLQATGTTASVQMTYHSPRNLFGRVRDGKTTPIKTFEGTVTFGSAGGTLSVSRQSDE